MYLPVFKADKEGEQVGGPGERDGHKVGLGSACPGSVFAAGLRPG